LLRLLRNDTGGKESALTLKGIAAVAYAPRNDAGKGQGWGYGRGGKKKLHYKNTASLRRSEAFALIFSKFSLNFLNIVVHQKQTYTIISL
jgi:hypothetical protein